ncbi:MAG: adenylate/guanylate cyclase domain-containing response regulator [Nitrospinae bacterium]|nr:adenylate/guanylate cyclase domain-containing response regulator [Nitrospinota bacterium]
MEGKILIVDDAPLMREMLADALAENGYAVEMAENGEQGFEKYKSDPGIGFIISDMEMPVLDGIGFIKKLRGANYEVPIVVLTGNKEVNSAMAAINAGADDYLLKDENIQETILMHTKKVFEKRKIIDQIKKLNEQLKVRNQFIKTTFGRYMSDEVVEKLLESPDGLRLGGESLLVTIVMTDLRGFSALSEKLSPEAVVDMLNGYLKDMTDVVFKYSGTIIEIIGDAIMILFGAPTTRPDDADRALACALEMQLAMAQVNRRNREHGLPELEMGIGVNTGKVVAGNVGSDMRVKYAVVGSNVNLAGRVESFTVGEQILITESTLKATSLTAKIGGELQVPFKGLEKPVTVHELLGVSGKFNVALPEEEPVFTQLNEGVPVKFEVLNGKFSTGEVQEGRITQLSEKCAVLGSTVPVAVHANLKMTINGITKSTHEGFTYAKVRRGTDAGSVVIHFTFVPQAVRNLFDVMRGYRQINRGGKPPTEL